MAEIIESFSHERKVQPHTNSWKLYTFVSLMSYFFTLERRNDLTDENCIPLNERNFALFLVYRPAVSSVCKYPLLNLASWFGK